MGCGLGTWAGAGAAGRILAWHLDACPDSNNPRERLNSREGVSAASTYENGAALGMILHPPTHSAKPGLMRLADMGAG